MSRCHIWVLSAALGWAASPAWGQGLYGAPEMVRLNPASTPSGPPSGYLGSPSGYSAMGTQYASPQPTYPQYSRTPAMATGVSPSVASRPGWSGYAPAQPSAYSRNDDPGYGNRPVGVVSPDAASVSNGALGSMTPEPAGTQPSHPAGPRFGESGSGFDDAACGNFWCGPACGGENSRCFRTVWYASANGLMMTRTSANGVVTTYETGNFPNHLMQTTDAEVDWRGGYEAKIGGRFGPQRRWAIEGGYWAVDGFQGFAGASLLPASTVSTPLRVDGIEFAGVNGDHYFNDASGHRLRRENRVQNVEVSILCWFGGGGDPCACSPFDIAVMAGPRYFVFEEELAFGSLAGGGTWGGNGGLDEAYLRDGITNSLIGGQIGFDAGCHLGSTLRIYIAPKFGIYNNHIEGRFDAVRGDGTVATPTAASGESGTYPVFADKNVFSFLGQVDAGVEWRFHPQWCAFIGYRLVAATGLGLADHQIPAYIVDIPSLSDAKHNGDLLLHGGLAGLNVEF